MKKLHHLSLKSCHKNSAALTASEIQVYLKIVAADWHLNEKGHLERQFKFKNFKEAWSFSNKVAFLAEELNHHPDLFLSWGMLKVVIYTHVIKGLHINDFIFAAKVDHL